MHLKMKLSLALLFLLTLCKPSVAKDKDYLELRVNEQDSHRYIRIESSGAVEFTRSNWYEVLEFRKGRIDPDRVASFLSTLRKAGLEGLAATYAPPRGGLPSVDPSQARLEWSRAGQKKVIVYSLRDSPQKLQEIHQKILNYVYEFPDGAPPGDYLRTYELTDHSLLGENKPVHATVAQLAKHPALRMSIEQPGRLVRAGPPGQTWERKKSTIEPTGFFLELQDRIHRVLVLEYRPNKPK